MPLRMCKTCGDWHDLAHELRSVFAVLKNGFDSGRLSGLRERA